MAEDSTVAIATGANGGGGGGGWEVTAVGIDVVAWLAMLAPLLMFTFVATPGATGGAAGGGGEVI